MNRPAACTPPVRSNAFCAERNRPGRLHSTAGSTVAGSEATAYRLVVCSASMLAVPHTPHALVVVNARFALSRNDIPSRRVTSTTL